MIQFVVPLVDLDLTLVSKDSYVEMKNIKYNAHWRKQALVQFRRNSFRDCMKNFDNPLPCTNNFSTAYLSIVKGTIVL